MSEGSESSAIPRIRVRIESLSDLDFGLALSFGSLILIGSQPRNGTDLLVNVFIFGFSFMIVVWTWIGYARTLAVLPGEAPFALPLNLGLLFCVALEPYLFYVVITTKTVELADPASIAYGLDAGLMFLFLAGLAYLVVKQGRSRREDNRLHPVVLNRFRRFMKLQAIIGGIYIASALPIFWIDTPIGPPRFLLWSSPFIILTAFRKPKSNQIRNETSQTIDWRSEKLGSQIIDGIDGGPGWIRAASQDPLTAYLGLIGTLRPRSVPCVT